MFALLWATTLGPVCRYAREVSIGERIVRVRGPAAEVGRQLGARLGAELEDEMRWYVRQFDAAGDGFVVDRDRLEREAVDWVEALPPRFRDELWGIAEGAGLPRQLVAEWYFGEQCITTQCSAAVIEAGGHVWVARNNDFVVPEGWGYATIREVDGRIPVLSFGRLGDVFVPTGVNREQLWLHYHYLLPADRLDEQRWHLPPFVWMMEALETCRTIADIEQLLADVQRADGMMLWAVDGSTDACAVFECGHREFRRRVLVDGWMVGANHHTLGPDPDVDPDDGLLSSRSRSIRLETLVAPLANAVRDHDVVESLIRVLADDEVEQRAPSLGTVSSNVACPATGEVWYTFGGWPAASHGDWQNIPWPWPERVAAGEPGPPSHSPARSGPARRRRSP